MGKHVTLKLGLSILLALLTIIGSLVATAPGVASPLLQSPTAPAFGPMAFTIEFDARNMRPFGSAPAFDLGINHFYAYTTFRGAMAGAPIKAYGYFTLPFVGQEVLFYENEGSLQAAERVWWEQIFNKDGGPLPAGSYRIVFEVGGQIVLEGETVVGTVGKPSGVTTPGPIQPDVPPIATVRPPRPLPRPPVVPVSAQPNFGSITFCEDVTEDGQPINPRTTFPAGTSTVNALFTYENMEDGMSWGQVWTRDGETYLSVTDSDWEEGASGWTAYYVEDDPLVGEFTLTLFIDETPVQQGSFRVEAGPPPTPKKLPAQIGQILFCEDVTDDGEPINPSDVFPEDTQVIWAYFTYENMLEGQSWGRFWELNGEPYVNATDLVWGGDPDGWAAYSIREDSGLPSGEYLLQIYLGDKVAQQASVIVEGPIGGPGVFGPITFAPEMTARREPVGSGTSFDLGVKLMYGIWDYHDVRPDQRWSAHWWWNGESLGGRSESAWGGQPDGTTYLQLVPEGGEVLSPGEYTLALYLDGELAQSSTFVVNRRKTLEELVHPALMPVWQRFYTIPLPEYASIPAMVEKWQIPVIFDDNIGGYAAYRFDSNNCNTVAGTVLVSSKLYNNYSWDEITATMGHELYHAYQMLERGYSCGCTQEKELEALIVELGTLKYLGRDDILDAKWSGIWDKNGQLNGPLIWEAISNAYSHCPKYEPR